MKKGLMVFVAVLAMGLVFGMSTRAMATFQLALQEDAGPVTVVASGPDFVALSFSGIFGDYNVQILGATAHNGTSSNLLTSITTLNALSAGTHTLAIYAGEQNYTLPVGPFLTFDARMGGTTGIEPGFLGTATFQAYADANNTLPGVPGTFTTGLQSAILNGTSYDTGDAFGTFARLATPFSVASVAKFTTTGVGDMNLATHVTVTAVPEPMSLILLGSGLAGVGLYRRLRKPKK